MCQGAVYVDEITDWVMDRHLVELHSATATTYRRVRLRAQRVQGHFGIARRACDFHVPKVSEVERGLFLHNQHLSLLPDLSIFRSSRFCYLYSEHSLLLVNLRDFAKSADNISGDYKG
jgi:hypothetical protein